MEEEHREKGGHQDPGTLEEIFQEFINPPSLEQTRTSVTEEGQILKRSRSSVELVDGRRVESEVNQTIHAACGCELRGQKTIVSDISGRVGCPECACQCSDCRLRGLRPEFRRKPGARSPLCHKCFWKALIIYVLSIPWVLLKALFDSASRMN